MFAPIAAVFALQLTFATPATEVRLAAPALNMAVPALESEGRSRAGRHSLEIGADLLGTEVAGTRAVGTGVNVTSNGSGHGGSLTYSYWSTERLAIQVSGGALEADARVTVPASAGTQIQSAVISNLLLGMKFQPFSIPDNNALRPFVTGAVGVYNGNNAEVNAGQVTAVEARDESVLGARIGAGFDVLAGRHFTIGAGAAYRFVSEFSTPIGADTKYSGAEFVVSFGVIFGKGK